MGQMIKMAIVTSMGLIGSTGTLLYQHMAQIMPTDQIDNNTPVQVLLAYLSFGCLTVLIIGMSLLYKGWIANSKITSKANEALAAAKEHEAEAHNKVAIALNGYTASVNEMCSRMNHMECLSHSGG